MSTILRQGGLCLALATSLAGCQSPYPSDHSVTLDSMKRMDVALPADGRLTARWFGVSTLLIQDAESSIMIDGFFSRPDRMQLLFDRIGPDEHIIRKALDVGRVRRLDAVLVSHSHYDHALDAPFVAKETNAILIGSESTLNIARAEGMPEEQLRLVRRGDRIKVGQFDIQVYRTPHAPTIFKGAIDESFEEPARFHDYKLGANHSFLLRHPEGNILVVPSAGHRPGMLKDAVADVVFLGIGTLGKQQRQEIEAYWEHAVTTTGARLVIPVHWDDFTRPFDQPLRPLPWPFDNVDRALGALAALALSRCPNAIQLRLMPPNAAVALDRTARQALTSAGACPRAPASQD